MDVPGVIVNRMGVGVGEGDGGFGNSYGLVHHPLGGVRKVHQHAQAIHFEHHCLGGGF